MLLAIPKHFDKIVVIIIKAAEELIMSEQGEAPQPILEEVKIDQSSHPNSLLVDVKGEQAQVEDFIKQTLYKIRAREIPPTNDTESTNLRLDIDDLFEQQREDIDKYFKGGQPYNPYIGTNWEIRAYVRRERQQPGIYHLNFYDNASMQRVKSDGLEIAE